MKKSGGFMWVWWEMIINASSFERCCHFIVLFSYLLGMTMLEIKLTDASLSNWPWIGIISPLLFSITLMGLIPLRRHGINRGVHTFWRIFILLGYVSVLLPFIVLPLMWDDWASMNLIWAVGPLYIMESLTVLMAVGMYFLIKYGVDISLQKRGAPRTGWHGIGVSGSAQVWGWGWSSGWEWRWKLGDDERKHSEINYGNYRPVPNSIQPPDQNLAYCLLFAIFSLVFLMVFQSLHWARYNQKLDWSFRWLTLYFVFSMGSLLLSAIFWGKRANNFRLEQFHQQLRLLSQQDDPHHLIQEPKLTFV